MGMRTFRFHAQPDTAIDIRIDEPDDETGHFQFLSVHVGGKQASGSALITTETAAGWVDYLTELGAEEVTGREDEA